MGLVWQVSDDLLTMPNHAIRDWLRQVFDDIFADTLIQMHDQTSPVPHTHGPE